MRSNNQPMGGRSRSRQFNQRPLLQRCQNNLSFLRSCHAFLCLQTVMETLFHTEGFKSSNFWDITLAIVSALGVLIYYIGPGLIAKWAMNSERRSAGLHEKILLVGDHEIIYLEGGKGELILMVHGFSANKDNWTAFAKYITPAYRVVAMDLPGFGDSTYVKNAS